MQTPTKPPATRVQALAQVGRAHAARKQQAAQTQQADQVAQVQQAVQTLGEALAPLMQQPQQPTPSA